MGCYLIGRVSLHTCHSFIYRALFYLVDANKPIRLQIYEEVLNPPLSDMYDVCDLCEELEPPNNSIGLYRKILAKPSVYMYTFAKTEQASKAKLDDFQISRFYVRSDEILPPCQAVIHIRFNLQAFSLYDKTDVLGMVASSEKLVEMLGRKVFPPEELVDDIIKHSHQLKFFSGECKEIKEQQEVAINAKLVSLLQRSIFSESDFQVGPYSRGTSYKVCKYAASRQDIIIYHLQKYIQKGSVSAVLVRRSDGDDQIDETEDESDGDDQIEDESKLLVETEEKDLGQLVADMVKLAADLCVKAILAGDVLIQEINIFGVLLNIQQDVGKPASLRICFNEGTTLRIGYDNIDITECMYRLSERLKE